MELRLFIFWLFLLNVVIINAGESKSSLTFVIDDTKSMRDDIQAVYLGANALFDKVTNSNSSQIEEFILVTFNDPDVSIRIKTKDRATFKRALAKVVPHNNDNTDCPEMSMKGIKTALETSLPGSSLFVFTDASAKDYTEHSVVMALSQKMECQITFVLTGDCASRSQEDYKVYDKIAGASNGQAFHTNKYNIDEMLKTVEEIVINRKHPIARKEFSPGYGHTFDINVDGDTKELLVTVSGETPKISVISPSGTTCPTKVITELSEALSVLVNGVKPGVYKVVTGSKSKTTVVVSVSTSIHFQHGFSIITPSSINDTLRLPVPDEKSHLAIKLAAESGDVELHSVQMFDMADKLISETRLKLVDKVEQFYTTDSITTPNEMFKIAIKGYDNKSKSSFTRFNLTPVKPQQVIGTINKSIPNANIINGNNLTAEYDKPLQLKCKVSGYPKPGVIWETDDKTAVFSHKMSIVELPYDYVSVLEIRSVKSNATYTCKAVNSEGDGRDSIAVKISTFFNVLESKLPSNTFIEYHKQGAIPCQVEASPPATVSWYKGLRPLKPDGNLELSTDGSILTIRSMEPYIADEYICEVKNSVERKVVPFRVKITGVEAPEINKSTYYINAFKKSNVSIQCQASRGSPKPTIRWWYKNVHATKFTSMDATTDTIHYDNVELNNAGTYRCMAENVVGRDYHETQLIVEYEPLISRKYLNVTTNQDDLVTLNCTAEGIPTPVITWKHNGATVKSSRHTFFRDGSIRFPATSSDEGVYECEAKNIHGMDSIRVHIHVTVPVEIQTPKQNFIEQMVGLPVTLPCRADGTPKPTIKWIFRSKNAEVGTKKFRPTDASGELRLNGIQQRQSGFYTCVATNSISTKNITYEVIVSAPPSIQYKQKEFRGVIGDLQLRIPCNAIGYPEPKITWSLNGSILASESRWFGITDDGTLIIKNLDYFSAGPYKCAATNKYGRKEENFNAVIDQYPKQDRIITDPIMLEYGASAEIPCHVYHTKTDKLQWFKDRRNISSSKLVLQSVSDSDAGIYTCRVSSIDRPAKTGSVKVGVGYKPRFIYNDEKNITFEKHRVAVMDCTANGYPDPEVKWFHEGKLIRFSEFLYQLEMTNAGDRGRYSCYVSNLFGTIHQEFTISYSECMLNIRNDLIDNQPLMLTPYDELVNFQAEDGYIRIPKHESIKLVCPSGFIAIPLNEITVTCETEQQFLLQPSGTRYVYSDLQCRNKFEPVVARTGDRCTNSNSEMLLIGFEIKGQFKEIYEVCVDADTKYPIYTKLTMQQPLANSTANNDTEWFNYGSPVDLDSLYDCNYQNSEVSSILDKEFHRSSGCCFAKRMLVNPKDVAPGVPQATTYTHLNVVPHWGTCNSKNWEDLEQRVRNLAASLDRPLDVWTGTAQELQLSDARAEEKNVILNSRGKEYQVPKYLWKVVQDPDTEASLAIIQVNVPDLKLVDAHSYLLCRDVCRDVVWMQSRFWRTVERGYTYCCSLEDFERAFRYDSVFPHYDKLLLDASNEPKE